MGVITRSIQLEPSEGADFMAGLEVKVASGSVWKLLLSELSGGQMSLLALSLILALLLFKPAPLYILDEVDAALDLSHTQNIGRMIREHFPHSQVRGGTGWDGMGWDGKHDLHYSWACLEGISRKRE